MLKAFLAVALLAASAGAQSLYPDNWKPIDVSHWGGLNLLQDTTMIDGDAQVAINVITDNTYLEKRPGNVRLATILPGFAVQYVNDWSAPNGSLYLIAQASQTVYETNFSGSPVALSSVAAGFNITTVPAFSRLEFADGYRPLWYWDGNSTGTVTDGGTGNPAPICTYIAFKDSRIWCANLPDGFSEAGNTTNGGGSSTVLISSSGSDGYWAVPFDVAQVDNVPNRFDFNPDDGDQITCLAATPWGMYVGKRNSSYIVKGNGNLSYDPRLLDPKIGCVDNRSVQMVYGILEWLAVDGVYGYDGSGPPHLMTRELDPLMQTVREASFSQGQWATQLQPDWASGTESTTTFNLPPLPWDYTSVPGEIFPSSGTLYDDNTSPALQPCTTNINPDTSLPWACGVGFASDTLVNIDTTSFPLSVGLAQVAPSTGGVQVWASSFPAGNYSTTPTTWTVSAGAIGIADLGGQLTGFGPNGIGPSNVNIGANTIYTTANSSGATPGIKDWNFGTWTFDWAPASWFFGGGGGPFYGECARFPGQTCFEYDFMANNLPSTAWTGYGVNAVMGTCGTIGNTLDGVPCNYTINILKSVAGVETTLASGTTSLMITSGFVGFTTMTVTRTVGGYITVAVGSVPVVSVLDTSGAAAAVSVLSALTLYTYPLDGGPQGNLESTNASFGNKLNGYGTGSIVSRIVDTGAGAPLAGVLSSSYTLQGVGNQTELDFYIRSSSSPNNDDWTSWAASSSGVLAVLPKRYWQYEALFTSRVASMTAQLSSVELDAVTTGYYYSKVDFIGTLITSWRQFGVTEDTPGTYGYAVRSASFNFLPGNTTIPWTPQTANVNVAVATGAYAQFRLDSTALVSNPSGASAAEPISAVFLRWDQGADLPVASDTLERRYMLCVTISTTATAPDTCLLRQKTGKWVQWSNGGTIGAMGLYNNQMVAADGGSTSKVWEIMQPNVYEDDGQAISSSWVGADETDGLVFNNKDYYGAMIDALPVQNSSATFSYQVNKSSGYVATVFTTDDGQGVDPSLPVVGSQYGSINEWAPPPAGYDVGKYIRIQFSDATLDNYFRINSFLFFVKDEKFSHP